VAEAGWVGSQEGKLWPVAMNANQYGGSETCGMCVAATGTGAGAGGDPFPTGSIRYGIVVDKCPECQPGSIDWRAPNQLDGRWSVDWYPVQCPVSGNFRFSTEGSNKWYLKVQVTNARAPVARLSLNIGGGYEVLARTADNHFIWQGPGVLPDGPILFQVESVFGDVVTASATFNYAIANQAVTSSAQFALSGAYRQALDGANPLATAAGANSMTGGQAAPPPPPQEQPPAPEQPQQQQPPTPPPAQEQPPAPEQPQQQPPTPPPAQEQPPAPEQQPPPSPPAQEQPPAPEQQPQPQQGCASIWGQCAGKGFSGPNCCPADYVCSFSSEWYSQCIPGSAPAPASAACAGEWEQCGGKGFTGASCCEANHECSVIDEWYSHCAPAQTPQQGAGIDCAGEWEQCGGKGFAGATCCGANHECSFIDEWYSHCAPVQASPPPGPSIDAAISSACSSVWQVSTFFIHSLICPKAQL
jgi:hypothetical protein